MPVRWGQINNGGYTLLSLHGVYLHGATSAGDSTFCTEQTSNYMYDRVKFIDEFILYVLYEPDSITSPFHSEVHA